MPSQTTYRPRSSLTRKLSSLCSRFIPTSVRAALRKRVKTGSPERRSVHERPPRRARGRSVAFGGFRSVGWLAPASLGTLGLFEQLAGVLERDLRGLTSEEPRQLADAGVAFDGPHRAVRPSLRDLLVDQLVSVGEDGDLRQVGDAHDLSGSRDRPERPPDRVG